MRPLWVSIAGVASILAWLCIALGDTQKIEEGRKRYHARCDLCHAERGSGTFMLKRRLGKNGSVLEQRNDLTASYIRLACRTGIGSMPSLTRVELPDGELDLIILYLTRPASERDQPSSSNGGRHE